MFDRRPRIKNVAVLLKYATLGFEPNIWAILIYAQLCSLYYFVHMAYLEPLIQLFRLLFGFRPLQAMVWLPAGVTNYPMAVAASIFDAVSPQLEIRSILFWVVIPAFSLCRFVRAREGQDTPPIASGRARWLKPVDLGAILTTAKRFTLLSLLLYVALFSAFSAYQDYQTSSATDNPNGTVAERILVRDCVQWVVVRANGTIQQSNPCNHLICGGSALSCPLRLPQ